MRTRIRALAALLSLVAGSPVAAAGTTASAQLRWQPSSSAGVVGYRIYTRALGGTYGPPQDAGLPTPAPDGTLGFTITGLDAAIAYAFAVTAYASDGTESALSNELTLSITTTTLPSTTTSSTTMTTAPPSTTSSSTTTSSSSTTSTIRRHGHKTTQSTTSSTTSTTRPATSPLAVKAMTDSCTLLPDGSPCYSGDPCVAGVCTDSTCLSVSPSLSPVRGTAELMVRQFAANAVGTHQRLVAQGAFAPASLVDPTVSGATVELRAQEDGRLLYRATVSGWAFHPDRSRTSFHYVVRRAAMVPGAEGLKRLGVRFDGTTTTVKLRAVVSGSVSRSALAWMVRVGEQCVRNVDLRCTARPRGGFGCD